MIPKEGDNGLEALISKKKPVDIGFDTTCPRFKHAPDIAKINILTKFHQNRVMGGCCLCVLRFDLMIQIQTWHRYC